MDGVRRCKQFVRSLDMEELKSIKVQIKRANIQGSNHPQVIYRGLDDPKSLVIHFRKETTHGIFDREDIVLNQEFHSRSASIDNGKEKDRSPSYQKQSKRSTSPTYRSRRSRSRTPRKRSYSPRRTSRRSRSPSPKPVKIPGLYIPPKSDYLRYEKRKRTSRSPVKSRSPMNYRRSSRERSRSKSRTRRSVSPNQGTSRTRRSVSPNQSTSRTRRSPSPKYSRNERHYKDRRSRSPRRNRSISPTRTRKDYRSRRSRSRSRHRERVVENEDFEKMMTPYVFQDGEYWMTPGFFPPSFIPRGFLPPPMVYPGGYPRMIMPRMPVRMPPPFRSRMYPPRSQPSTSRTHLDEDRTQDIPGVNENNDVNSGVTISEIIVEKSTDKN